MDEGNSPSKHLLNFPSMNEIQNTAIASFLNSPTRHASIVAPVGVGKTLMALSIWDRLGRPNTLIVVPRIVLVQNPWLKEMQNIGITPESVGQYYSEAKEIKYPITITLYQTLIANPQVMKGFDFIVFDEEQFLSKVYGKLLDEVRGTSSVLGMTGTFADAARKNPNLARFLPVVYQSSIAQAREKKMLAPAEIIPVYVDLADREMTEYRNLITIYETTRKQAYMTGNSSLRTQGHIVRQRINQILSNTASKITKTLEIIEGDPSPPTLVFSLSLDSIDTLEKKLEEKGIRARTITHELHDRVLRQEIVNGFGEEYNVLLSVGTLEVGFNVPNASREIIMANTGGSTRTEQRLGRVLRRDPQNPDKIAKVYVEIARGTIDSETLRLVNHAYTRLQERGSRSRARNPTEHLTSDGAHDHQTTLL